MGKKNLIKKQRFTFKKEYPLWAIILLLLILQGLSMWQIIKLREYAERNSGFTTRVLLRNTEEDRYKHPIIDVAENRVYIPEARIHLPLNDTTRDLRYDYRDKGAGFWPKAMYLSVSSVVGRQSDAQYHSCDKMIILAPPTDTRSNGIKKIASIEPTKGGLSEIFENTEGTCWNQEWYTNAQKSLTEALKQAKNY